MGKGYGGMPMGGMNPNALKKQAMKLQQQMDEVQEQINAKTLEASSGGGAVKVTVNGKLELTDIKISPEIVDPDDIESLQDLVMSAVNEALREIKEYSGKQMAPLTGGFDLGGLF